MVQTYISANLDVQIREVLKKIDFPCTVSRRVGARVTGMPTCFRHLLHRVETTPQ